MKVVEASEIEVVAGQHGRDATIQRLEIDPDGTRYRLKCRQETAPVDGYIAHGHADRYDRAHLPRRLRCG